MLLVVHGVTYPAVENYAFDKSSDAYKFDKILKEFRCVTCPNQNIADSGAPIAKAMQEEIYQRLQKGESEETIRQYLLSSYGDYVLYRPPMKKQNWLLWLGPFGMLLIGFILWVKIFYYSERHK